MRWHNRIDDLTHATKKKIENFRSRKRKNIQIKNLN